MAHGPRYRVPYRRHREGKTDYRKRLKYLLSGKPRFVVRRFTNNFVVQVIEYKPDGDKVVVTVHSKRLYKDFGWKGHRGNMSTAYLTGLVCGFEAISKGITECILDIGRQRATKGNSLFAALKGAIDAGLRIPYSEEILPSEDRIRGEHITNYAKLLKEQDPDKYKVQFSRYINNNLDPTEFSKHFDEVKTKIVEHYEKLLSKAQAKE